MKLTVENDFRQKIMSMAFAEPVKLDSRNVLTTWKQAWLKELSSWHSPYKLLLDGQNLQIIPYEGVEQDLELLFKFFKGAFLRKVVAYNLPAETAKLLPAEIAGDYEDACSKIGIRAARQNTGPGDFRSQVHLENDFRAHVMELSFQTETAIETTEQMAILKSKITNNLMQWHSKWNLLIDCHNLTIAPELADEFAKLSRHFKGLFMLSILGYSPKTAKTKYPFEVYRSRHKAVTHLERVGALSGNEAHCQSGTKPD